MHQQVCASLCPASVPRATSIRTGNKGASTVWSAVTLCSTRDTEQRTCSNFAGDWPASNRFSLSSYGVRAQADKHLTQEEWQQFKTCNHVQCT